MNELGGYDFEDLQPGMSTSFGKTITEADIVLFAGASGDNNAVHINEEFAQTTPFKGRIAHGMLTASVISAAIASRLPGPGTIYLEQALRFSRPVRVGDTLTVTATVLSKDDARKRVELDCQVSNQHGERVLSGVAKVLAPTEKVRQPRTPLPQLRLFDPEARLKAWVAQAAGTPAVHCGVVHPCHPGVLEGVLRAAHAGLIVPQLIGPPERIHAAAEQAGLNLQGVEIIEAPHSDAAAAVAAQRAADGRLEALIAGSLALSELLDAVRAQTALHTRRRLSHVFRLDVPGHARPLWLTDAMLHAAPTLADKADIARNAIDLLRVMGVEQPRVAVLSASEQVDAAVPSTIDAAALCKMVDAGQIGGGLIDGPLAFDSAVSPASAQGKHPRSAVAGQADVLLAPDMETGSMLARQLLYLAGATACGVIVGARVPITVVTHRLDSANAYLASAVLAKRLALHHRLVRP